VALRATAGAGAEIRRPRIQRARWRRVRRRCGNNRGYAADTAAGEGSPSPVQPRQRRGHQQTDRGSRSRQHKHAARRCLQRSRADAMTSRPGGPTVRCWARSAWPPSSSRLLRHDGQSRGHAGDRGRPGIDRSPRLPKGRSSRRCVPARRCRTRASRRARGLARDFRNASGAVGRSCRTGFSTPVP